MEAVILELNFEGQKEGRGAHSIRGNNFSVLEKGTSFENIDRVLVWYLLMSSCEMNYNNLY